MAEKDTEILQNSLDWLYQSFKTCKFSLLIIAAFTVFKFWDKLRQAINEQCPRHFLVSLEFYSKISRVSFWFNIA